MPADELLNLPLRSGKPRKSGITEIMLVDTPTAMLQNHLEDYRSFIDFIKFGIGCAYITPNLKEKIEIIKSYDIDIWFGGTLFEKFYSQNRYNEYLDYLQEYQIDWIEISTGTIDLNLEQRLSCIEQAKPHFHVISEVGSKDPDKVLPPSEWISDTKALLAAGCEYVILEGRDSATVGIYTQNGNVREGLLADITDQIDCSKIIFEAPEKKGQNYFIKLLGPDVNLGNIKLQDILTLECQRQGLRSDTFYLDDSTP
ncbi:MAG: phosphosulfolactate synthase [Candidatus Thiodiazotropha sp. (ex Epidulcina cf. delphinae)]|nr:phosphosulfolactate synthase [Candidatus Thiodiazotropha sp. (ex Epidulcina cf. delphinae)]